MYDELIKRVSDLLPKVLDKNEKGEFEIEAKHRTTERIENSEYLMNLIVPVLTNGGEPNVSISYYSVDDDETVYLAILVFEHTTDEEIIASFSEEFGWIEKFEDYKGRLN